MEKYFELLKDAAERLTEKAEQGDAIVIDLECVERLLRAAERKIETANISE